MSSRETWGTKLGFIFATMGAAVGCGNLWRFPYMVGKHGGAAFLLVYIAVVAFVGFPLLTAEVALGRKTQKDPVGAFKEIAPGTPWYIGGYMNVAVSFMWLSYLTPIFGWFLGYLVKMISGGFVGMTPQAIADYFPAFTSNGNVVFAYGSVLLIIISFLVYLGIQKGVEKANNILMPMLFILLIILVFRALTLPGAAKGLEFYLKPDFSKLTLDAVLGAMGQALFSVGVAVGVGIVFGSYLPKDNTSIAKKTAMVCIGDTAIAFLAGLMIFPSIFSFGLEPNSGGGLLFVTLPNVFNQLPMGQLIGAATIILFMIAMLTSQVACFETVIRFMEDSWNINRKKAIYSLFAVLAVMVYLNAHSMEVFNAFDYVTSNILINGGALLLAIFVGWKWKTSNMLKAACIDWLPQVWNAVLHYVIPISILIVWSTWFF